MVLKELCDRGTCHIAIKFWAADYRCNRQKIWRLTSFLQRRQATKGLNIRATDTKHAGHSYLCCHFVSTDGANISPFTLLVKKWVLKRERHKLKMLAEQFCMMSKKLPRAKSRPIIRIHTIDYDSDKVADRGQLISAGVNDSRTKCQAFKMI